jgi:hypothetical protein
LKFATSEQILTCDEKPGNVKLYRAVLLASDTVKLRLPTNVPDGYLIVAM